MKVKFTKWHRFLLQVENYINKNVCKPLPIFRGKALSLCPHSLSTWSPQYKLLKCVPVGCIQAGKFRASQPCRINMSYMCSSWTKTDLLVPAIIWWAKVGNTHWSLLPRVLRTRDINTSLVPSCSMSNTPADFSLWCLKLTKGKKRQHKYVE